MLDLSSKQPLPRPLLLVVAVHLLQSPSRQIEWAVVYNTLHCFPPMLVSLVATVSSAIITETAKRCPQEADEALNWMFDFQLKAMGIKRLTVVLFTALTVGGAYFPFGFSQKNQYTCLLVFFVGFVMF